jgi:glycerate 2-kinase
MMGTVCSIEPRAFLRSLFDAAVAAAQPAGLLAGRLPASSPGRTVVLGAGKAAAAMARAVEQDWRGPLDGLVVTRHGHGVPCEFVEVVEAGHPLPDARGSAAAARALALARELGEDDLLIALISGGGSALLSLPAKGLTLEDKQAVSRSLLSCGARIEEINSVRKHLSAIKGGRLAAAAHPARVVSLLISDVPGDDPAAVASGPTVPDPTTFADALAVLDRYGVCGPASVLAYLRAGADAAGRSETMPAETPKPGDPDFSRDEVVVLATARDALQAAAAVARSAGITPIVLGDDLEGEAREVGAEHARLALASAGGGGPVSPPCVLLSGGETTVTVRGSGRGGRNAEYLLSQALVLGGHPDIWAIACDTDGVDGTEDNAGALAGPDTLVRAAAAGMDAGAMLSSNDAYSLFGALDDLVVSGPTLTNVNDFRAQLILDLSVTGREPDVTPAAVLSRP